MSHITDLATAVGTDVAGGIALIAAYPAFRAVRESKRLREDQARPFVVVTLEPSGVTRKIYDLVVRNHGETIARDVRFSFDKPLRSTNDSTGFPIADVKFLHDGIPTFAPRAEYRVMFDSIPHRKAGDLPDSYTVTVTYKDRNGKALPPDEYILDSALTLSAPYAREYNLHNLVEEVKKLREAFFSSNVGR